MEWITFKMSCSDYELRVKRNQIVGYRDGKDDMRNYSVVYLHGGHTLRVEPIDEVKMSEIEKGKKYVDNIAQGTK